MKKLLFNIIITIRQVFSPIIYLILRLTVYRGKLDSKWEYAKNLNIDEFSYLINSYSYKSDPFFGLLDFSPLEPDFFFLKKRSSRDCDDFAQMWYWWAEHNKYEAYIVALADNIIKNGHTICIFKKYDSYIIADYTILDYYYSLNEAMEKYKKDNHIANYKNLQWKIIKKTY